MAGTNFSQSDGNMDDLYLYLQIYVVVWFLGANAHFLARSTFAVALHRRGVPAIQWFVAAAVQLARSNRVQQQLLSSSQSGRSVGRGETATATTAAPPGRLSLSMDQSSF